MIYETINLTIWNYSNWDIDIRVLCKIKLVAKAVCGKLVMCTYLFMFEYLYIYIYKGKKNVIQNTSSI